MQTKNLFDIRSLTSANNLDALLTAAQANSADGEVICEQLFERFKNLKDSDCVWIFCKKDKCTQEDYGKEYHACELYEDKFITYKIKAKNILARKAQGVDVLRVTDAVERLLHVLDWDSILARVAEEKIQWKFNPPSATWWGGWWKCLVQMTKAVLRKILGRAALDYEELITVLCDCERVINFRPLTYMSEDVDDIFPLTPEMFLREIPEFGVPNIDNADREKLSKRAKYLQKMRQLRSKFRIEYLGQLRQQFIKNYRDKPLSVGEIVLLEDNSKKRAYWSLARAFKLIPGRDGHIRLTLIKTENSEFLRPVQMLFRLEWTKFM
ncbi:integrase catalytic domain-containing protein [Trichonephila clavipes]|nr:integrase catalytic domain-containing protein [Trichonephila clavipes]